jgi:diguanylate cyclase (GGDEF)-like protein/PAS domain S-box-containing protein
MQAICAGSTPPALTAPTSCYRYVGMSGSGWSRQDVLDLVRGRFVVLYGPAHHAVPAPAWIVEDSLGEVDSDAASAQATCHPDDRRDLLDAFFEAVANPGRRVEYGYRTNLRGHWVMTRTTLVNLADHPDVGGILCAALPGTPTEEPDLDLANGGDHDDLGWILCRLTSDARILEVEGKVVELTGRTVEQVLGSTPLDLLHPDTTGDSVAMWWPLITTPGGTARSRRCFLHPDGTEVWAECTYLNRLTDGGKGGDVLWIAYDITDKRVQEQALRESHAEISRLAEESRALAEDLRLLADEVPAAVFRCELDGSVTFHNNRWTQLLPGADLKRVHDVVDPAERHLVDHALARLVSRDGDRRTLEVPAAEGGRSFLLTFRSDGAPHRIVGSVEDVTTTVQLRREASHDQLTGLLNRKGLEDRLLTALHDDPAGTLLVFFDLDGFKAINDVHGHGAGDAVLQELGARLARAVRPTDTVSRYGGDEFVLVCSGVVDDGVDEGTSAIIERLQLVLGTPILFDGGVWQPAASIGTARAEPGDDAATLIHRADLAMFEAKRARFGPDRPGRRPA